MSAGPVLVHSNPNLTNQQITRTTDQDVVAEMNAALRASNLASVPREAEYTGRDSGLMRHTVQERIRTGMSASTSRALELLTEEAQEAALVRFQGHSSEQSNRPLLTVAQTNHLAALESLLVSTQPTAERGLRLAQGEGVTGVAGTTRDERIHSGFGALAAKKLAA
jgi:hypothetical protein